LPLSDPVFVFFFFVFCELTFPADASKIGPVGNAICKGTEEEEEEEDVEVMGDGVEDVDEDADEDDAEDEPASKRGVV
jgi:hypothetical protein